MDPFRREFLKLAGFGLTTLVMPALLARGARAQTAAMPNAGPGSVFDVRAFGAIGDGKAIDTAGDRPRDRGGRGRAAAPCTSRPAPMPATPFT